MWCVCVRVLFCIWNMYLLVWVCKCAYMCVQIPENLVQQAFYQVSLAHSQQCMSLLRLVRELEGHPSRCTVDDNPSCWSAFKASLRDKPAQGLVVHRGASG